MLIETKAYIPRSKEAKRDDFEISGGYERKTNIETIQQIQKNYEVAKKIFKDKKLICLFIFTGLVPTLLEINELKNIIEKEKIPIYLFYYRAPALIKFESEMKISRKVKIIWFLFKKF